MYYGASEPVLKKKPSQEEYVNDILHLPWWKIPFGYRSSNVIFGSYVYKHMVRGEPVNDIDVLTPNTNKEGKRLAKKFYCKPKYSYAWVRGEPFNDFTCLTCDSDYSNEVKIDLVGKNEYLKTYRRDFINTVILTSNGLKDIEGNEERKKFVIESLKQGKYCPWVDMRDKDKEYFKDFEVIDCNTCKKFGFTCD